MEYPVCPVCKTFEYSSAAGLRMHMHLTARGELFWKELGHRKDSPHFDYYKAHTHRVDGHSYERKWNTPLTSKKPVR